MNVEGVTARAQRARLHAALADPTRVGIVDILSLGDAAPSELQHALDIPSNLLAHHIKILEAEGLVTRGRSEADRRRSYLRLAPGALDSLQLTPSRVVAPRVVFVCTANSARSQLAAALWRRASTVPVASAGTDPAPHVDPGAVATARRHKLPMRVMKPRLLSDVADGADLIVTVCDNAHEELLIQAGLHWSVPDPVPVGTSRAFDAAYDELSRRVTALAPQLQAS